MKSCRIFLFFVIPFALCGQVAQAQSQPEKKIEKTSLNMNVQVDFAYNSIACTLGNNTSLYHFNLLASTLEYDVEVFDYLTVGVMAGYKFSYMKETVGFDQIPLTLSMDKTSGKFSGLLLGANLQSTPFSDGDWSIKIRGDFLYSLPGSQDFPITLEVVSGTATVKESFWLATVDLLLQYEGFAGMDVFAGARLNLLHGQYDVTQTIEDLIGSQTLAFKQKNLLGPLAGVMFELGSSWEISLKASLISRFNAALSINYVF